jgi:hypothetical protein
METDRFETLLRYLATTPSRRTALRLLAGSSLGGLLTIGGAHLGVAKKKKVTLCHKGLTTITVSKKAKKKHIKHGDTVGACPTTLPPVFSFKADPMTGANEVPPVVTMGTGSAQFTIQGSTICGTFQATGLSSSVTGKHIHAGVAGVDGGVVVDFTAAVLNEQLCVPCPGTVCADIIANPAVFYANTHTTNNPDGEVRAQLQAVP